MNFSHLHITIFLAKIYHHFVAYERCRFTVRNERRYTDANRYLKSDQISIRLATHTAKQVEPVGLNISDLDRLNIIYIDATEAK